MLDNLKKADLDFYSREYNKGYVVAITPRSGSTMLCDLLDSSGIAGHPKEYLNQNMIDEYFSRVDKDGSILKYFEKIVNMSKTDNGVFGIKISYYQAKPYIESGLLDKLLNNTKVINLFRRNILKQAISLYIASEINYYHTIHEDEKNIKLKTVKFDKNKIFQKIYSIYLEERGWIEYLDKKNLSYMKLFYEDNIIDINQTVKTILSYIGLNNNDFSDQLFTESKFKKISTDINNDFYLLFLGDNEIVEKTLNIGIDIDRLKDV